MQIRTKVTLREVTKTDESDRNCGKRLEEEGRRTEHLYLRDSKVMDGNQSSSDLLRIVRNLWAAGWDEEGGERA